MVSIWIYLKLIRSLWRETLVYLKLIRSFWRELLVEKTGSTDTVNTEKATYHCTGPHRPGLDAGGKESNLRPPHWMCGSFTTKLRLPPIFSFRRCKKFLHSIF